MLFAAIEIQACQRPEKAQINIGPIVSHELVSATQLHLSMSIHGPHQVVLHASSFTVRLPRSLRIYRLGSDSSMQGLVIYASDFLANRHPFGGLVHDLHFCSAKALPQ